jgi:hypothetical protein
MTESSHATVDGIDLTQMLSNLDALQQKIDSLTPGTVHAADFAVLQAEVSGLADQIKALSATATSSVDHSALVALQAAEAADHQALAGVQNILANLAAVLGGHIDATLPPVGGTGTVTPPPVVSAFTGQDVGEPSDANKYLLTVPAVTDGSDIVIGTGPNTLELVLASSPSGATDPTLVSYFNLTFIRPDGSMQGIAADIPVTSFSGEGTPKQSIKALGPWGRNPKFILTASHKGAGLGGLFIGGANIDLAPLGLYGVVNYRGDQVAGASGSYISVAATTLTLMETRNAPTSAGTGTAPAATADTITGALINGASAQPATFADLAKAVPDGGTLTLPPGKFLGAGVLTNPNMILEGQGQGVTILDGTGLHIPYDKAVVVLGAPGQKVRNLSITGGATTNGNNGAGVRQIDLGLGIGVDLADVELYGNQDGLLTFPGNVTLTRVHAHDNGKPRGSSSPMMFTSAATRTRWSIRPMASFEKCLDVHAFKSRAYTNNINGGIFTAGGNGSCMDIPDGGKTIVAAPPCACRRALRRI